jgi:hypothetical protein
MCHYTILDLTCSHPGCSTTIKEGHTLLFKHCPLPRLCRNAPTTREGLRADGEVCGGCQERAEGGDGRWEGRVVPVEEGRGITEDGNDWMQVQTAIQLQLHLEAELL